MYMYFRPSYRYRATLMRAKFDKYKDIKDMRVACALIEEAEKKLEKSTHYHPKKCEQER